MTEQSVAILPGRVTQVAAAMASGTTLYNADSTAGIWVSASPSPGTGTGFRIGPQGSVAWTTDGAPVYAATDPGVTRTLPLTVTDNIGSPVDPVSVGAAVAAQLLAKGVPSVLTGASVPFTNLGAAVDVSGYASVTVNLYVTAPTLVTYTFTTAADIPYNEVGGGQYVMAAQGWLTFTTDVTGPFLRVSTSNAGALFKVNLYGTNRALGTSVRSVSASAYTDPNDSWTNGVLTSLNMALVTNGGNHRVRLAVTGSAKGFLYVTAWDPSTNAIRNIAILDTGMGHVSPSGGGTITEVQDNVILPAGSLTFSFYPATTGTYQVVASVIPTP